jgi:hypothetical protein
MLDAVQGRNKSVRDTISKGGFVQGSQHPRIFGLGHIGRGDTSVGDTSTLHQETRPLLCPAEGAVSYNLSYFMLAAASVVSSL